MFFILINQVSEASILWPLVAARGASVLLISFFAVARRQAFQQHRRLPFIALYFADPQQAGCRIEIAPHAGGLDAIQLALQHVKHSCRALLRREALHNLIAALQVELKTRTQEVEAAAPEQLPVGLGRLTSEILEREVADWNRFQNRRQVASYTGLCPSEHSSGQSRQLQCSFHQDRRDIGRTGQTPSPR